MLQLPIFPSDDNTIQEESFEESGAGRTQAPLTFKAGFLPQLLSHPIITVQSGFVDDEILIFNPLILQQHFKFFCKYHCCFM